MKQSTWRELAIRLIDAGCVQFTVIYPLSSGQKAPIYIDLRPLPSVPELGLFTHLAVELRNLVREKCRFDSVIHVPTGSTLLVGHMAQGVGDRIPILTPKLATVEDEKGRIIGQFKPGQRVIVCDDVATSGASIMKVVNLCRENGLIVNDAIVVIDRGEGARQFLAAEQCKLHSLFTLRELLSFYHTSGFMPGEKHQEILRYLENPFAYADNAQIAEVMR